LLINPVVKKPLSSYLDSQQQSIASQVMREAVGSTFVAVTNNDADDSSDDSSDDDDDDDDDDSSTSSSETMQQLISTAKNKIDSKINDVSTKFINNASPTTMTAPATRTSSSTLTTPATASNIKKNVAITKRTNKNKNNTIPPTNTTVTMNNNKNNGNNSKKRNNNNINNNNNSNSGAKNTPQIATKATPASKKVVTLNTGSFKAQQNSKLNNRQANADLLKSLISSDTSPALPNAVVAPPAVEAVVAVVTQSSPVKDRRLQQTRKRKVTELTPDKSKTASPNKKKK
jgi:hypothetical protein